MRRREGETWCKAIALVAGDARDKIEGRNKNGDRRGPWATDINGQAMAQREEEGKLLGNPPRRDATSRRQWHLRRSRGITRPTALTKRRTRGLFGLGGRSSVKFAKRGRGAVGWRMCDGKVDTRQGGATAAAGTGTGTGTGAGLGGIQGGSRCGQRTKS